MFVAEFAKGFIAFSPSIQIHCCCSLHAFIFMQLLDGWMAVYVSAFAPKTIKCCFSLLLPCCSFVSSGTAKRETVANVFLFFIQHFCNQIPLAITYSQIICIIYQSNPLDKTNLSNTFLQFYIYFRQCPPLPTAAAAVAAMAEVEGAKKSERIP